MARLRQVCTDILNPLEARVAFAPLTLGAFSVYSQSSHRWSSLKYQGSSALFCLLVSCLFSHWRMLHCLWHCLQQMPRSHGGNSLHTLHCSLVISAPFLCLQHPCVSCPVGSGSSTPSPCAMMDDGCATILLHRSTSCVVMCFRPTAKVGKPCQDSLGAS